MITGIQSWEIIQQRNGFGNCSFTVDIDKLSKQFTGGFKGKRISRLEYRFVNEETDMPVTPWVSAELCEKITACTIENIPIGGLYYLSQKVQFEGGSHSFLEFQCGIRHVGVGDVFLIVGQSNAAGWGRGFMTESPEYGINVLRKDNHWDMATNPLSEYHSPIMSFAKLLHKMLGYPIGLIPRAVGGAPISDWIHGGPLINRVEHESKELYTNVTAVLCYHGCSEVPNGYLNYKDNFTSLVIKLREIFHNENLPVFTFQLNRMQSGTVQPSWDDAWSEVREIQRTLPQHLSNTYVVPTIDALKMSDVIHNGKSSNIMLGERMGYYVLGELYKKCVIYKAPDISRITVNKNIVKLYFDYCSHLSAYEVSTKKIPITVHDDMGNILIDKYSIDGNEIELILERDTTGDVYVSAMPGVSPNNFLFDDETQLPVLCFNHVLAENNYLN